MTRKKKNIIMILLLIVLVSLSAFNIYFISTKENDKKVNIISNNSTINKEDSNNETTSDTSSNDTIKKENNETSTENDSNSNIPNDKNIDNMPRHKDNHMRNNNFHKEEFRNPTLTHQKGNINMIYYLFLALECIFISIITTYLIMSNFNKNDFKETFDGNRKVTYTILAIIIASLLLNVESIITKSILNNNIKVDSNITEKINIKSNNES